MPTETSADPPPTLPNKRAHPHDPLFAEVSYGVLLAVLFLGEELHAYHLVALALIVPGVVLATARHLPHQFRRTT